MGNKGHTRKVSDEKNVERKWTALLDEIEDLKKQLFWARKEKEAIGSLLLDVQQDCIKLQRELARANVEAEGDDNPG